MKLDVQPCDLIIEFDESQKLYTLLTENNLKIRSSCGGFARCGDCIVKITSKDPTFGNLTFEEKSLLGNVYHITKERLSCQMVLDKSCEVDISEHLK